MADGPFANAGLGMFGTEKSYVSSAMTGPKEDDKKDQGGGPIGNFLAGLIGLSTQKPKTEVPGAATPPSAAVAPVVPGSTMAPAPMTPLPYVPYAPLPVSNTPDAASINKLLWGQ